MYDYPPTFQISRGAVWSLSVALLCVALLTAVSARILRLHRRGTLWLIAFATTGSVAELALFGDVSRVPDFLGGVELWVWASLALVIIWLSIAATISSKTGQMTLIEHLVVIGIIAGLIWYLAPVNGTPRHVARTFQCSNNLKWIGVAIHNDAENGEGRLIGATVRTSDGPPRSWRIELLPYLDQQRLRTRYDDSQSWGAPVNLPVSRASQHPFVCPNNVTQVDGRGRSYTAYLACTGPSAFFPPPAADNRRGRRIADIRDGTSHTAMIVEACGQNVIWTEPRDLDVDRVSLGINFPGFLRGESSGLLSSHDRSGVGMVMGDGSVQRLSANVDPSVLRAMLTIDGQEPVRFD